MGILRNPQLPPELMLGLENLIKNQVNPEDDIDDVVASLNEAIGNQSFLDPNYTFIEFGVSTNDPNSIILQLVTHGHLNTLTLTLEDIHEITSS